MEPQERIAEIIKTESMSAEGLCNSLRKKVNDMTITDGEIRTVLRICLQMVPLTSNPHERKAGGGDMVVRRQEALL